MFLLGSSTTSNVAKEVLDQACLAMNEGLLSSRPRIVSQKMVQRGPFSKQLIEHVASCFEVFLPGASETCVSMFVQRLLIGCASHFIIGGSQP